MLQALKYGLSCDAESQIVLPSTATSTLKPTISSIATNPSTRVHYMTREIPITTKRHIFTHTHTSTFKYERPTETSTTTLPKRISTTPLATTTTTTTQQQGTTYSMSEFVAVFLTLSEIKTLKNCSKKVAAT